MATKLIECVNAMLAIRTIENDKLPLKTAHALMLTKRKVKDHAEFYEAEEKKLLAELSKGKDEKGYLFDADKGDEFLRRRSELASMEVELGGKLTVKAPETISPAALEALMAVCEVEL